MPTVLRVRFPGRRYHATPWGHHVNEGQVEWPPSPWRLLRALLATGFAKLGWPPEGPPPLARRLVERLAAEPPVFTLPPVSLAHTRHYVDAGPKKPLVFDTWANVDDGEIEIRWALDLSADERALLGTLAENLGYLGRAESWVAARLAAEGEPPVVGVRCAPARDDGPVRGQEAVRVLCALPAEDYAAWREAQVAPVLAAHAPPPGKRLGAGQQKKLDAALAPFPADLIAALCAETATLQAQGWSSAPGSRDLLYHRRSDALDAPPVYTGVSPAGDRHAFALLALATPSRGGSALPPRSRVFAQGRLLHRAIASVISKQLDGDPALAAALLGQVEGRRSEADHRHAHLLFLDLNRSRRLDHVLVWTPMGMDDAARGALGLLRRTFMKGGAGELTVTLVGTGDAEVMRAVSAPAGEALARVLGPPEGARVWVSATPYVAPRLLKERGRDSLEGLVRGECVRRGLPEPLTVERRAAGSDPWIQGVHHFVLHDDRHQPPRPVPHELRLTFPGPVQGPICLGYGAHVGLGRFEAAG